MDVSVSDVLHVPMTVRSFFDFGVKTVNYDGRHGPLLSIQVIELVDGVFIGFTMDHSVADGTSLWHFISALSEIYVQLMENRDIIISRKPMFKRYFPKGYGPVIKVSNMILDESTIPQPSNHNEMLQEKTFHFTSKSILTVKSKANEECGVNNAVSSFQALSAFIWRSITRARNLDHGLDTCCALVMNARPKFNPPISNDYFGNFITRHQSMCKVGELLENGLGWAAILVHQLVVSQDENTVNEFYEMIVKYLSKAENEEKSMDPPFYSPNVVFMGGSTRFGMYGSEFGLGKARAVFVGYGNKEDGKVTTSPGRDGDGIDLEICLHPENMNALEMDQEFMDFVTLL